MKVILTPRVFLKWQWFCHRGETEVGLFGTSGEGPDGLLTVVDAFVPNQECNCVFTDTDEGELNELLELSFDKGIKADRIGRIWMHTHPGDSPRPSGYDDRHFMEAYKNQNWALMLILARGGDMYAEVQYTSQKTGKRVFYELDIEVDWSLFPEQYAEIVDDMCKYEEEYKKVRVQKFVAPAKKDVVAGTSVVVDAEGRILTYPETVPVTEADWSTANGWSPTTDLTADTAPAAAALQVSHSAWDEDRWSVLEERGAEFDLYDDFDREFFQEEFVEWLHDNYQTTPAALGEDNLKQMRMEFCEHMGIGMEVFDEPAEEDDIPMCILCADGCAAGQIYCAKCKYFSNF